MNNPKSTLLLFAGALLLLFLWWSATPSDLSTNTGLNGVRLLAQQKVMAGISTLEQMFLPVTAEAPPSATPVVEPLEPTVPDASPTPVVAPPPNNGNGPPPWAGGPERDKDKDKDKKDKDKHRERHENHNHDDDDEDNDD